MLKHIVIFIIVAISLISCSDPPKERELSGNGINASKQPTATPFPVRIIPEDATAESVILLKTEKNVLRNAKITWYINGIQDKSADGIRFVSRALRKGDIIQAIVIKDEHKISSNSIEIKNSPPVMRKAGLNPVHPKADSILLVEVTADDVDQDKVTFRYKWRVNGKEVSTYSFIESEFARGDSVTVDVVPFDGEQEGRGVTLKGSVMNAIPDFLDSKPAFDGKTYSCRISASDPDGDPLTYELENEPEGMTIDDSGGMITWKVPEKLDRKYKFNVLITDGHGGKIIVPITAKLGFKVDTE